MINSITSRLAANSCDRKAHRCKECKTGVWVARKVTWDKQKREDLRQEHEEGLSLRMSNSTISPIFKDWILEKIENGIYAEFI